MSILSASHDDFAGGGKPLPPRAYKVTVLEAKVEETENGHRLTRMYGNIRTPEGAVEFENGDGKTFRIGNRKLFARSWIDHKNEQAASIGQREIKREALSAGLLAKPAKGETTELDYPSFEDYAQALIGRDVIVRTKIAKNQRDEEVAEIATWLESA